MRPHSSFSSTGPSSASSSRGNASACEPSPEVPSEPKLDSPTRLHDASETLSSTPPATGAEKRTLRLAYLVTHPIQYQAPLLRRIAQEPGIDLTVLFISDFSLRTYHDPGFGASFAWDVPLVEGYEHRFLKTRGASSPVTGTRPWVTDLRAALEEGRFDALWMHGYASITNLRALAIARRLGIKVLVRAESQLTSAEGAGLTRRLKEAVIRRIFKKVDAFLAIGSMNRDYYRHYGVPEAKMFTVPYAVDNAFFQGRVAEASLDRERLRAELGLEPGRPVFLFASKFIGRKRPGDLLEAYAQLPRQNDGEPKPYLLYVGDGELRPAVEARARELNLNSVHFLGFKNQRELPAFLDLCDLFVLASEREPWGLVVNEAMNAGKAVVVTPEVGAHADLVEHGVNGFVVPPRDVPALAEALREAAADPARLGAMGKASRRRIDEWDFEADVAGLKDALAFVLPSEASKR